MVPKKFGNQKEKNYWTEDTNIVLVGNIKYFIYFCNMFKRNKKQIVLPHWGDAKNWVIKVIDSCTETRQISTARRLMYRWRYQYSNKIDWFTYSMIERELQTKLDNKWEELMKKQNVDKGK